VDEFHASADEALAILWDQRRNWAESTYLLITRCLEYGDT
jgi:hypothetical protein